MGKMGEGGGGVLPEKFGEGVRPASKSFTMFSRGKFHKSKHEKTLTIQ